MKTLKDNGKCRMDDLNRIVGLRLSELLKDEKQETTRTKLNVEQGTVSKWKTGKQLPNPETLVMIADMYGVSIDWLLGISDVKERNSLSIDQVSYEQVVRILDKLFKLSNIEVLDFYSVAREKNLSDIYRADTDESLRNNTDYIKVNDRVLSYLLRRRKIINDFDEEMAEEWLKKSLAIFKQLIILDYRGKVDEVIATKPLSTFKEGDWSETVQEIQGLSEQEMEEYLESKSMKKEGK